VQQESAYEKKVLILVSDGEDNNSRYSLKEVLNAVSESKIIIYTIGLLSSDGYTYGVDTDAARRSLQKLAEVTGGASFFPRSVKQVEEICKKIAGDLRSQYTIGYRPSNDQMDGSWRKVSVRMNLPKNSPSLKVRTKTGYYAPRGKRDIAQEAKK
jgi:Ca-activated chloride channel family protein